MTMQKLLGLGSYQTARAMLHRYRTAMVRPAGREVLNGRVEVDETFIGGEEPGPRGRGALGKTLVAQHESDDLCVLQEGARLVPVAEPADIDHDIDAGAVQLGCRLAQPGPDRPRGTRLTGVGDTGQQDSPVSYTHLTLPTNREV